MEQARQNPRRLGRPLTAGLNAPEIRRLYRAGVAKTGIAKRLQIGRTSIRRIPASISPTNPSADFVSPILGAERLRPHLFVRLDPAKSRNESVVLFSRSGNR